MRHSVLRRIIPLYIVIFFGFLGYSMMITLFTPLFMYGESGIISIKSSLEYRVIILGIVLALFPFAQFIGSPILGALSDRFGRRPVLLISLYIAPICYGLIACSLMMPSLSLLMASTFFAGASQSNIAIAQSAISDVAPKQHRGPLFGYIFLSASLAYVVGPLLGGKLAFHESIPFWIVFALLVLTLFWIQFAFKETKLKKEPHLHLHEILTQFLTIFTVRKIRIIYFFNFCLYFAVFGFFRCYPMYIVNEFHVDVSKLSEYIAWVSVPIILVNFGLTGSLFKRFSAKNLTFASGLLTGLFMILIIFPKPQASLWVTLFLTSSTLALLLPASSTMLSYAVSDNAQGRVMGNNQSLQVAAEAFSAFIGGLIASINIKLSLIILGIFAIGAASAMFLMRDKIPE